MLNFDMLISKGLDIVWGPITIVLLLGLGIYLSFGTKFVQFRLIGDAVKSLFEAGENEEGGITPFQALMTSMAATIGIGNIVGVAAAITVGGPGAIFWMWVSGALGGATKFAEVVLAVRYRVIDEDGDISGGPMYYIENGIKEEYGLNVKWLGVLFAAFTVLASFGIGNMTQANSLAQTVELYVGLSPVITGIIAAVLTGIAVIGGIEGIGKVTEKLVPTMAIAYLVGGLIAVVLNAANIPMAFRMIFSNAFTATAVGGGFIGTVLRTGISRGMFSNEAGLGSGPIAHAASKNNDPIKEGLVASLGVFLITIVVCTLTALVILTSGLITVTETGMMEVAGNLEGVALTTEAFNSAIPGLGSIVVSMGIVFFAFSTLIGWYYFGFKSIEYIGGEKRGKLLGKAYTILWVIVTFIGSIIPLEVVWNLSDLFNGLMAFPNLIAVIALSPVVFNLLKGYDQKREQDLVPSFKMKKSYSIDND